MTRRGFLGAASTAAGVASFGQPRPPSPPNIVVVLVDDMGFSDIAPYGSEIPTPNLDRLSRNGVRFRQCYNTARCSPTRASLLTGLYPHQAGMGHLDTMVVKGSKGYQGRLSADSVTIAEVLQSAGYFTAMTGKWHMGQLNGTPPWKRGFDRSLNLVAGRRHFSRQHGIEKDPVYLNGEPVAADGPELGADWYGCDLWARWGLKFLDEARERKRPFFLYKAHCAPHFPLMAPRDDIEQFRGKFMAGWDRLREERYRRQIALGVIDAKWPLSKRPADSPAWDSLPRSEQERFDHMMAIYAAMIQRIDRSMGALMDGLEKRGELDNTLLLFLSDNGGNAESGPNGRYNGDPPGSGNSNVYLGMNWATLNNTPFFRHKHFVHEGGIATPLLAHWPAGIPAAKRNRWVNDPAHLIDVMATAVEASGAQYPKSRAGEAIQPMEGVSLLPAIRAARKLSRSQPLYFMHEGNCAIRAGRWKLVRKYGDEWELYDMQADRTETRNLAGDEPKIARELAGRWEAWAKRSNVEPWTGPRHQEWGDFRPRN